MKKLSYLFILCLLTLISNGQEKKADSTEKMVVITLDTTSYKQLLFVIENNIDSKQVTKAIMELFQKNARLMDMEKPKKQIQPKKN